MVNRFRDSFHRKTFLFLTANDAGWRGNGSHTSMTEHVTHRVTHMHSLSSSQLCPLCLSYFASPSLFIPFATSEGGKWGNGERAKKKKKEVKRLLRISPSLCVALPSLPPSLLPPPASLLQSVGCPDADAEVCQPQGLNLLILLSHAAPLHSERSRYAHVHLTYIRTPQLCFKEKEPRVNWGDSLHFLSFNLSSSLISFLKQSMSS